MNEHLTLNNLHKAFGKTQAVKGVSLNIKRGELVTLLGPSGCGKTTTLHMIAGFHTPDAGEVLLNGRDITFTPAYRRKTPMVFQEYALFPHLSVFENIAYGLKIQKANRPSIREKVEAILNHLGLPQVGDRFPNQLSGGQQQRIALARALVLNPEVLLLDEPLSNFDAKLRVKVRYEIKELRHQFDITAIFVTHDQEEALSISDKIAVMNKGVVEQFGTPWEVYYRPKTEFIAGFIGETNFLTVTVTNVQKNSDRIQVEFRWKDRKFIGVTDQTELVPGQVRKLLLRPEAIDLLEPAGDSLRGIVKRSSFLGTITRYWIEIDGQELIVDDAKTAEHGHLNGAVGISFAERNLYFL